MVLHWKLKSWETTGRSRKGNFVSCHGNMASFLLETNDIWNIRNHNQHLIFQLIYESTTGNFILFIDRLRYF